MLHRGLGYFAAGIVVGLVITGYIVTKEVREEQEPEVKQDGLFAEVRGNTVRTYRVEDGRFCGYSEPKVFASQDQAVEWVVKETNAKLIIAEE